MSVIQGSTGTHNRHLEVQVSIFIDFSVIWGASWDTLWIPFCDLSVIWGAKVGDGFQVHVFDDPEVERPPVSSGCMCYNHGKNSGF